MHEPSTERQQLLHYQAILRGAGQFVTNQRRALLQYLLRHRVHPTTAQIATAIGRSGSASLATVYNNLALFAELQIVRTLRSPKHKYCYHTAAFKKTEFEDSNFH